MPKYYIKSNTLELIFSTDKNPMEVAVIAIAETTTEDILDEYFYIDERGYRDYTNADKHTKVISTQQVIIAANNNLYD